MVAHLEETGTVPPRPFLKKGFLKEELEVQVMNRGVMQGGDNDRHDLGDFSSVQTKAPIVAKKPPLLKRRPILRPKQEQENMKVASATDILEKEMNSVKPPKLEEKATVKQRLERRLSIRYL